MGDSKIEQYFLRNLIQIMLFIISVITGFDLIFTAYDISSLMMDGVILLAVVSAVILRKRKHYTGSVIIITMVPLATMFYHALSFEDNTVPMTVILTIGFILSILLRGTMLWTIHTLTVVGLIVTFAIQTQKPEAYLKANENEVITLAITYLMLYLLVVLSAAKLKTRYDKINHELKVANNTLIEKSNEIEAQNEELVQSQDKLSDLNQFLEQSVEERTKQVIQQSEKLLNYAYVNSHHVRGPVARVLGLIQLSKIDPSIELPDLFEKIEYEAKEIDTIITRINTELEKSA